MHWQRVGMSLVVVIIWIPSRDASGFDPRTHVWVGQQVLNDVLPDGRVTIDGREYDVPPSLVKALKAHPSVYRMGHIGPDAHPDLIVGQSYIHPGVEHHWATDDWMKWIQKQAEKDSPEALAYAYGCWGHAAGDVIAHTYVNTYAGDYFFLFDGEAEVELRHFTLEHFIGDKTPPLEDHTGRRIGLPHEVVKAPREFIADALILNSTVFDQYSKGFAGAHLMAMYRVKDYVTKMRKETERLNIELPKEVTLVNDLLGKSHSFAEDALLKASEFESKIAELEKGNPALQMKGLPELKNIFDAQQQITEPLENVASEAEKSLVTALDAASTLQSQVAKISDDVLKQVPGALSKAKNALKTAKAEVKRLREARAQQRAFAKDLEKKIGELEGKINAARKKLDGLTKIVTNTIGSVLKGFKKITKTEKLDGYDKADRILRGLEGELRKVESDLAAAEKRLRKTAMRLDPAEKLITQLEADIDRLTKELDRLKQALSAAQDQLKKADEAVQRLKDEGKKLTEPLREAREKFQAARGELEQRLLEIADFGQQLQLLHEAREKALEEVLGFQRRLRNLEEMAIKLANISEFFKNWEADIIVATHRYVDAATQSLLNTMKAEADPTLLGTAEAETDPIRPFTDWWLCYAPVFTGVPIEVGDAACQVTYAYRDVLSELDELLNLAQEENYLLGMIVKLVTDIKEQLKEQLILAALDFGGNWLGEDIRQFYALHGREATEDKLNEVFAKDEARIQLLEFDNIAELIKSDLALKEGAGKFHPQKCALASHAVTLAKLTLLDAVGLNKLAASYDVKKTDKYTSDALYPTDGSFVNVLYRVARSIDGNHQWRGRGLPYLRQDGKTTADSDDNRFGYCWCNDAKDVGFRFWVDDNYRTTVFPKLFPGELTPGIKPLEPTDYPPDFHDCKDNESQGGASQKSQKPPQVDEGKVAQLRAETEDQLRDVMTVTDVVELKSRLRTDLERVLTAKITKEIREEMDSGPAKPLRWDSDYGRAFHAARSSRKPLLVLFLPSPAFPAGVRPKAPTSLQNALLNGFERCAVLVNSDDGRRLQHAFRVTQLPAAVVVDASSAKILARRENRMPRAEWHRFLVTHALEGSRAVLLNAGPP